MPMPHSTFTTTCCAGTRPPTAPSMPSNHRRAWVWRSTARSLRPPELGTRLTSRSTRFFNWNLSEAFSAALSSGKLAFLFRRARVPEAAGTQDFIGLNYYDRRQLAFDPSARDQLFAQQQFPRGVEISPSGEFGNTPEGMFDALKWAKRFGLPIIVTENGIEDAEDGLRPRYLVENIHQMWHAVNFSYPIKGYFHWTLVDNFEWASGWTQRFGLWGLDVATQARFKRKSADLYAAICKENGISSEMVQRYAPEVFGKLFPG